MGGELLLGVVEVADGVLEVEDVEELRFEVELDEHFGEGQLAVLVVVGRVAVHHH